MELIRGSKNLTTAAPRLRSHGCVLAIGSFDGMHLGHQEVIRLLKQRAYERKCAAAVLLMEPSPIEVINPAAAPPRLSRWREKFLALDAHGVDRLITLRFDRKMLAKQPDDFVREYLVDGLGTSHVIVGHDYRYGTRASGTSDTLLEAGDKYGFSVEKVPSVEVAGVVASNASIRKNLLRGEFEEAAHLLGRSYRMRGRVVHGKALGRTLGYPTANLRLMRQKSPVWGISAVRVHGIDAHGMDAVASIGTRPTVNGVEPLLEVHIFDFVGDLYGKTIEVEFVAKLREELKFDSLDALVVQMDRDSAQARDILKKFHGFAPKLDFRVSAGESDAAPKMTPAVDG